MSKSNYYFSFNKGVGPYNPTQSNHYDINLIWSMIQLRVIMDLIFKNLNPYVGFFFRNPTFFFLHPHNFKYPKTNLDLLFEKGHRAELYFPLFIFTIEYQLLVEGICSCSKQGGRVGYVAKVFLGL